MIKNKELDAFLTNGFNVLFIGKHGTGKTSIVLDTFKRHNLKFAYFSASTMDPWTDLIGIPKEVDGFIDYIKPKNLNNDLEAIFIDEFNRAPAKVTNALMELIQFKSINGKKFPNLKVVWAAINPDDDAEAEYAVNRMDDAHKDRFQIHIQCDDKPNILYFKEKFGDNGEKAAKLLIENMPELKKQKSYISPRRLEQALLAYTVLGTTRFTINTAIGSQTFAEMLDNLFKMDDKFQKLVGYWNDASKEMFLTSIRIKAFNEAYRKFLIEISNEDFKSVIDIIGPEQAILLKRDTDLLTKLSKEKINVLHESLPAVQTIDISNIDIDA